MKQKMKVTKTGRGRRREWMLGAGLIAYLIGLVIRIPLIRIIGDKGLGFFAPSMEIFALISTVLCYGISRAVAILVKYRVKRDMYKSARRVYRSALFLRCYSAYWQRYLFFSFQNLSPGHLHWNIEGISLLQQLPRQFYCQGF